MAPFLFIAFIALCGASVLAFIKPKMARPNEANPSRIRAGAPFLGMAIVALIAFAVVNQPDPAADQAVSAPALPGTGLTYAQIEKIFLEYDCPLEAMADEKGQKRWTAKEASFPGVVEILGQKDDLTSIRYTMSTKGDARSTMLKLFVMTGLAHAAFPNLSEPGKLISNAVEKGSRVFIQDGRVMIYETLPLGFVSLTFKGEDKKPEQAAVASTAPETAPQMAAAAETAAAPDKTAKGLGVAQAKLKKYFTSQGYVFEPAQGEGAAQKLIGENKATTSVVMLMGPEDDIRLISLIYIMEKENTNKALEAVVSMADTLKTIFPKWEKPGDWLVDAIRKEGDLTKRYGAVISYKPSPALSGVTLFIVGGE